MRLSDYRKAVADGIRAAMPELLDVKAHAGRFGLEELKSTTVKAPAARIAFINMKPVRLSSDGKMTGPVNMAVFLITSGGGSDGQLLDLLERAASVINMNTWGLADIAAAKVETIENLFNEGTQAAGVCVGAVTFEQPLAFGPNLVEADRDAWDANLGLGEFYDGAMGWHTNADPQGEVNTDDGLNEPHQEEFDVVD